MQISLVSVPYKPSFPLTGDASFIYRGENMLLRGVPGASQMFYAAYNGSANLNEPVPVSALTGTISYNSSSLTVTGAGTLFQDELHLGELIYVSGQKLLSVKSIESQTSFTLNALPSGTGSGTAYRTRILRNLDTKRASLLWGDVSLTDKGSILAVGAGELYVNGAVLPGTSLTASRRAQIAIFDSATDTYSVTDIGFDDTVSTTHVTITVVASGGTKNMSEGYYSFKIAYYSDITNGYSNASDTFLSGGTAGYHITSANSTFNFDFSGDVIYRPAKATGYIIYASAFGGASSISQINAIQGGWFELRRVPFTELTADAIAFDYVDSDLSSTLASFDNETPPDAEFISLFTGYVNLISTNGKGVNSTGRETETSPGPLISPMKSDNLDAYPAANRVPTEKGETILGYVNAAGRMFPMTPNTLQASTATGLPSSPFTLRPFWQRGFASPFNLVFVDDTLYGFTTKGPYRSIATGDTAHESNDFAASIDAQTSAWNPGYVFVAYDPKNSAVCYFHSCCSQNAQGYWETEVYPYSLKIYDWMPRILLTSPTRDMIVTGTATVQNTLDFIAGGRRFGTSDRWDTWSFDTGSGDTVTWYLAFSYMDGGAEFTGKILHRVRPKGKFTNGKVQIYAVTPDSDIDITDLETGANPVLEIDLDDSTTVKQYEAFKRRAKNMLMWTARLEGESVSDGTIESTDQFHELTCDVELAGQIR